MALLTAGLYLPFIRNPLVFDDWVFFSGGNFAEYATHPIGLEARLPGYFSLAFTEVIWSSIEAHRVVSLALHLGCAVLLYALIFRLLAASEDDAGRGGSGEARRRATACAMLGAGAFAIHPAAVYGAGYLVQRSIVMATLFALLALHCLLTGLRRDRHAWTLGAAAFYTLAVMAKEHGVLLCLAAAPLALALEIPPDVRRRQLVAFAAACIPAALWAVQLRWRFLGQAYEPHLEAVRAQLGSGSDIGGGALTWSLSAINQMGLFFEYLRAWMLPDVQRMAIDLRVDPFAAASPASTALIAVSFAGFGAGAFLLLLRRGRAGLLGFGLFFFWVLFLVELSVFRFQEPFVLYRSYLWAPGVGLAAAAAFSALSDRVPLVAFLAAVPLLQAQAYDRLESFSSALLLWEDAAAKLPAAPVLWGSRVLYNLGGAYLRNGEPGRAGAVIDRCLAAYRDTHHCVFARGAIHFTTGEFSQALTLFTRAAEIDPRSGVTQHRIGLALERLGRLEEAKQRFRGAAALGYQGGDMALSRLGESTQGRTGGPGTPKAAP